MLNKEKQYNVILSLGNLLSVPVATKKVVKPEFSYHPSGLNIIY